MIIDDEGDQATLNTKQYLSSMSSTYESVLNLKNKIPSHCFLSITATPQANILIETFDKLSPDFGELVYPGDGYCGLQEFHGENADKRIYEIPATENNLLDDTGVPQSLYKAMAMFFVGNGIRKSRGDMGNHAMLIHPSQKKFDHKVVVNKIQGILDDWKIKAKLKLAWKNDLSYQTLRKYLLDAYNAFINDGVISVPFDELEHTILDTIKKCSPVLICNSDENASENSKLYKTNIFVGGNLVERGITIKLNAVQLKYKDYILHLIDTPGHVDFNYEVSRSLAACEGAILVVDAAQGIEAQTLANLYLALDSNLTIIPVINKIDLPNADIEKVTKELEETLGFDKDEIILTSAKNGIGIKELVDEIVKKIPSPKGDVNKPLQALIFDSFYDAYRGVVVLIRIVNGKVKIGDKIKLMATNKIEEVVELGVNTPKEVKKKNW